MNNISTSGGFRFLCMYFMTIKMAPTKNRFHLYLIFVKLF